VAAHHANGAWLLINTVITNDEIACAATSLALAIGWNSLCHNGFHLKALLGYVARFNQTSYESRLSWSGRLFNFSP
jgi:hypothetical protein